VGHSRRTGIADRTRSAPTNWKFAARLSSGATLVFATRMERNMRTERMTPPVTGQASFKTVR